jgi:hypothetical protein
VLTTPDQPIANSPSTMRDPRRTGRFTPVPTPRRIAESIVAGDARYGSCIQHTLAFLRNVYLDIDAAFPIGRARELRWRLPTVESDA